MGGGKGGDPRESRSRRGMSMMPLPPDVASEIEQGTAQLKVGMGNMPAAPPVTAGTAGQLEQFSAMQEEPTGMERSPSLAKLAALLRSPSLEGLQSWETIHPNLLPEFTPRFTVTADPCAQPQLQGDVT